MEDRTVPAAFVAGDLVAVRVGTGSATLGANATATFLDEYKTSGGSVVQSISLPTASAVTATATGVTTNGTAASVTANNSFSVGQAVVLTGFTPTAFNNTYTITAATPTTFSFATTAAAPTAFGTATVAGVALAISGSGNTEGQLLRSLDGHSLSIVGYQQVAGGATGITGVNREVGVIAPDGTIDLSTKFKTADAATVRSAVSADGTTFFLATSSGVRTVPFGNSTTTSSTQLSTLVTSPTAVQISPQGQLYIDGSAGINATTGFPALDGPALVGTGLPTTGAQPISVLLGFPTATDTGLSSAFPNPRGFVFSPDGNTVYIADSRINGNGGLYKYAVSGNTGSFLGAYTFANASGANSGVGLNGLAGDFSNPGSPILYATTVESATTTSNRILRFADVSAPTVVATAATNQAFRGIAFAPTVAGAAPTTITYTPGSTSTTFGVDLPLSATVTGSGTTTPFGVVSFRVNGQEFAAAVLVNGTASVNSNTNLPANVTPYNVTAVYTGDSSFAISTSAPTQPLTVSKSDDNTSLTSSSLFTGTGQTISLTATVQPNATGLPTGVVTFFNNGVQIGTVLPTLNLVVNKINGNPVAQFQANLTTTFTTTGTASITAMYNGDGNFNASTSSPLQINVISPSTTTVTSSSPGGAAVGSAVTLTAAVTGTAGVATGSVQFFDNQLALGTAVSLNNGQASVALTTALLQATNDLTPGAHSIIAVYIPDSGSQNVYVSSNGLLTQRVTGQAFGANNTLIERVGDGVTPINAITGNSVYLDEYTPTGTLVQSIALPIRDDGTTHAFVTQAQQSTTGAITLAGDGQTAFLAAYDAPAPVTVTDPYFQGGSITLGNGTLDVRLPSFARTIARIDGSGAFSTGVALSDALGSTTFAANTNAVYSANGSSFYVAGVGGIRYVAAYTPQAAAQTSVAIASSTSTLNDLTVAGGQLYVSSSSGTVIKVAAVGTGVPTTAGQTLVNLPGITLNPTSGATVLPKFPVGLYFTHLDGAGAPAGINTLYVGDDGDSFAKGSITKFSLNGGTWTQNGTVVADGTNVITFYWLAGQTTNGSTTLYSAYGNGGSGNTGTGALYKVVDTNGYGQDFSTPSASVIASVSSTSQEGFRGVSFAPQTPKTVASVTINGGAVQRSTVTSIAVTFTGAVTIAPGAFSLRRTSDNATITSANGGQISVATSVVNGNTVATLTFINGSPLVSLGSLAMGVYQLTVSASVTGIATDYTTATTGAGRIFRLYGDSDGSGAVDAQDVTAFLNSYGTSQGNSAFRSYLDSDGNNSVDAQDVTAFLNTYGITLP